MKLPVRNAEGKELRTVEVDETVFGIEPNGAVLHQAFVAQRNNQRWGTAQTKTRGLVQGSTRKIRRQKYTGRARQGSARAPQHVGGGTVFGPHLRSYRQALPKKMRRLAIRSALSGKVADGQLVVIDQLAFERPRTKEIVRVLRNVGIERSALIVIAQQDRTVLASVGNLEKTKVLPAAHLNVVDMLNHRDLLMTVEAVRVAERLWGRTAVAPAPVAPPAPEKRRRTDKAVVAEAAPVAAPARPARPKRAAAAVKAPRKAAPEVAAVEAEAPPVEETPKPSRARRKAAVAETPPAAPVKRARPAARRPKPQAAAEGTATEAAVDATEPRPAGRRTRKAPKAGEK